MQYRKLPNTRKEKSLHEFNHHDVFGNGLGHDQSMIFKLLCSLVLGVIVSQDLLFELDNSNNIKGLTNAFSLKVLSGVYGVVVPLYY